MDCSPPGSSVHEIFQARILEWVAISFSRGSSQPRDWTQVSCTAGRFFTDRATREAQNNNSSEDYIYYENIVDWLRDSLILRSIQWCSLFLGIYIKGPILKDWLYIPTDLVSSILAMIQSNSAYFFFRPKENLCILHSK